ncbi:MAG: DUF512 domain-containing protein [Armatimonadota bacterium]
MAKSVIAEADTSSSSATKHPEAIISAVEPDSPAALAGVEPGDRLVLLNGTPVTDVLDYRFRAAGEHATALIRKPDGRLLHVRKSADEDFGMDFEADLFDRVRLCRNNCPFCFVYQLPKGLRPSLYIKDDDYRLSFIHGNYITLTNLSEQDYRRIEQQRLSPLYVSVHATDPKVRGKLLGVKGEADVMGPLRRLADAGIQVHCQVVLCPGINDGEVLHKTVADLSTLYPAVSSVAVVPVAVGKHMPPGRRLAPVTPATALAALHSVKALQNRLLRDLGTRFVWAADEFYLMCGLPLPSRAHYEGFPQLEDGVGIARLFLERWRYASQRLPRRLPKPHSIAIVTAPLGASVLSRILPKLQAVEGLSAELVVVPNSLFGERITVTGLMTGRDVIQALADRCRSYHQAWIPSVALRENRFLDDVTPEDIMDRTGVTVQVLEPWPTAILQALRMLGNSQPSHCAPAA